MLLFVYDSPNWECSYFRKYAISRIFLLAFKIVVDVKMAYWGYSISLKIHVVESDCIKTMKVRACHSVTI